MNSSTETVTVYAFRLPEPSVECPSIAGFKAARETIEGRYRGEVLEGTAESVSADELDDEGRYRRVATGWGELN